MKRLSTAQPVNETIRVFLRGVPGLGVEAQRKLIRETVGLGVEYVATAKDATVRDMWAKQARPGDRCVLTRLSLVAEPKRRGARPPTVDMGAVITGLVVRGCIVVDAMAGLSSKDAGFQDRFADEMNIVRSGRRLTPDLARERGAKGNATKIARSKPNVWKRPEMQPLRRQLLVAWRSREYANDAEAAEAVNGILRDMGHEDMGSKETVRRVLGKRT